MRSLVVGLALAVVPPAPVSIDGYLDTALDGTGLPGVSVVVTHGDRIVRATGAGHDSTGSPMTADTPMRVASVSKSFTAAAVLTLGIDLDAPVTDWLPWFPRGVTVRHLLNQTSGLTDSSVDIGRLTSARTLAEYVSMLPPVTPTAAPGTSWAYSNVNYDVAARLVEIVSGQPFERYMRDKVFGPLGMRDSSVGGPAPDGYNSLFGMWFSRPELSDGPAVNGSGAVVTTARDMGRWLMAQTGNGPFAASMLRTMHEPSTVDDYGMGWSPGDDGLLVHSGNLWTYNAIQAIDPKTGYGYAVMTNGAGMTDDTGAILSGLVALTRGETPEAPGGSRQLFEWVLAGLMALSLTLGTLGVVRSKRWAGRRLGQRWMWVGVRLVPALLPVFLFVFYPQVVSFISAGRTVLWAQLFYFALPLTVTLAVTAAAGLAVFVARIVRLRSAR